MTTHVSAPGPLELFDAPIGDVLNLPVVDDAVRRRYAEAPPFGHLVIDGFVKNGFEAPLHDIVAACTTPFERSFDDGAQQNKTISTGSEVNPYLQVLAAKLSSAEFLRWLEDLTGLRGLIPDPYYNTEVGYYHVVGPGGVLGSHVDHSHHASLHIPHVLNLVLYITPDWRDEYGGELNFYDDRGREIVTTIPSHFNRAAIFACHPTAYHGVRPIADDVPVGRHSLYLAYYAVAASEGIEGPPGLLRQLPGAAPESVVHPTYFVLPARQLLQRRNWPHLRARLEAAFRLVMPPIVQLGIRRLRHRRG